MCSVLAHSLNPRFICHDLTSLDVTVMSSCQRFFFYVDSFPVEVVTASQWVVSRINLLLSQLLESIRSPLSLFVIVLVDLWQGGVIYQEL